MPLEVEVKFFAADLPALRSRLRAAGGEQVRPRVHERNVVYDTADFRLKNELKLLRLRQDERVRLTLKAPAAEDAVSEAKVREELEVEAAAFAPLDEIIRRLGFEPKLTYEKYRETFYLDGVEIVLDEMPYGDFIELEGEETAIRVLAGRLGLDWSRRLLTNYLELMRQLKDAYGLPFDDITFANFEELETEIDPGRLWG